MANLSKIKRDKMIAFLEELKKTHADDDSIRAFNEIENHLREKKYGLIWEEHSEEVDELLEENIPILTADPERRLCKDETLPWNFIIEGDNLQALYLLEKTHKGKVDCIYIDPPYNTGAKDWKYNNDYVDSNDVYRHSKWLSMMKRRLEKARHLLNPQCSVLIVTIDDKEYLHLGCMLEELFPTARIQMISSIINPKGSMQRKIFPRTDEYIFFVWIGDAEPKEQRLNNDWLIGNAENTKHNRYRWQPYVRANVERKKTPSMFYPIFVNEEGTKVLRVGASLDISVDRNTVQPKQGEKVVFPINTNGEEAIWHLTQDSFMESYKKGFVRLGAFNKDGMSISYLSAGMQKKIEDGILPVVGRNKDGSVIFDINGYQPEFIPGTQWRIKTHDATEHGTKLLQNFIGNRFSYPKALYAVHDVIRFFISDIPNAIVVDFFAGSGTTMHAVNLLNAEDGGNRICVMVTNNEVSAEEEKAFIKRGVKKGSAEWESHGIAKYVNWPRTVCSINGVDVNGNPLKGDYFGSDIPMSNGFKANVKYFKCSWTPRKPEDYLLSNALCLHIKEMIELQNAIEVDNVKNVLILNKKDFKDIVENPDIYEKIENIWVNQNIILNAEELKLLEAKGFKYIPREFFGQELREAAE